MIGCLCERKREWYISNATRRLHGGRDEIKLPAVSLIDGFQRQANESDQKRLQPVSAHGGDIFLRHDLRLVKVAVRSLIVYSTSRRV